MLILLSLALTLHPGDKIIWGEDSNCKGLILSVQNNLLKVKGVCYVHLSKESIVPFLVEDYISINDVQKVIK